jgi:hypothetical protein
MLYMRKWEYEKRILGPVSGMSENVGASTSRNSKGLHDLYRDNFPLLYMWKCGPDKGFLGPICEGVNFRKKF